MGKLRRDRASSPLTPGDSTTRCHQGPPTRSRWEGCHLARPGGPPGMKSASYPKRQTSKLKKDLGPTVRPQAPPLIESGCFCGVAYSAFTTSSTHVCTKEGSCWVSSSDCTELSSSDS